MKEMRTRRRCYSQGTMKKRCDWERDLGENMKRMRTSYWERDWEGLPQNILDDILDKLVDLRDYIRFGAVCSTWRSVSLDDRNYRGNQRGPEVNNLTTRFPVDRQLPLLMIPHLYYPELRSFYSPAHGTELEFQLPFPKEEMRFVGSSLGWLISIHSDFSITLFSPFSPHPTKTTSINLPPLLSSEVISHDEPDFYQYYLKYLNASSLPNNKYPFYHEYYLVKAILSADPALHPHDYIVMVIYGTTNMLAYMKPGRDNKNWVYYNPSTFSGFCDVIYSQSTSLFYTLHATGAVYWIDPNNDDKLLHPLQQASDAPPPTLEPELDPDDCVRYIVESCQGGHLLQVLRFLTPAPPEGLLETSQFIVYKLNSSSPVWNWDRLKTLGDQALFLGDNSSISVKATDFPMCRPGSIYFSLPYVWSSLVKRIPYCQNDHYDMGVCNLDADPGDHHYIIWNEHYPLIIIQAPIWLVPTFQHAGAGGVVVTHHGTKSDSTT